MSWVAVGVAAVGVATSVYSGSQAAKSSARQASAISNAENEAIAKQNMSQMVRNSYRTGILNMQLGLQKKQAVQQGFNISAERIQALGAVESNAEAAGAIGASADAIVSDMEMKYGQAQVQNEENYASMLDNYNNELEAMRMNALNQVVEARKYEYNGPSSGQIVGSALIQGALNFAGNYAMRSMSLGVGPKAGANVSSSAGGGMQGISGGGISIPSSYNRWG